VRNRFVSQINRTYRRRSELVNLELNKKAGFLMACLGRDQVN
jgi:hypothetical protein